MAGITGFGAVLRAGTPVILDVMDDMQHEAPVGQQSPAPTEDVRGTSTVTSRARLLANRRRVRRA